MKIPKINKNLQSISDNEDIIEDIDIELLKRVEFETDIDPEDEKNFSKAVKKIKILVRDSFEYKSLVSFLKKHMSMDSSFLYKNIKNTQEKKFSIEIHHSPFPMEDIIVIVIYKRLSNNESLVYTDIADEIMYLHYTNMIGLVSLDKTLHALIHSNMCPEVFIPLQHITFGEPHDFFKAYKQYIPENIKVSYSYLQELSMKYENIKDIIPTYLKIKKLYYRGFIKIDEFEKLLDEMAESE